MKSIRQNNTEWYKENIFGSKKVLALFWFFDMGASNGWTVLLEQLSNMFENLLEFRNILIGQQIAVNYKRITCESFNTKSGWDNN